MNFLIVISDLIVPLIFVFIIFYAYSKKVEIYDVFIDGAKDGLKTVLQILPTLIGLMVSVGILRASGALTFLEKLTSPFAELIGYPKETIPLTFMRLISSSASTGILLDLYKTFGPDSFIGRFVSVMMSSTETIAYIMSIYFMSVKITKTRYTLHGAIVANIAGIIASLWISNLLWGK